MMIIGCDFHPSWQQIAWLDTETGESGERKLVHASGEAQQFYEQLAAATQIPLIQLIKLSPRFRSPSR